MATQDALFLFIAAENITYLFLYSTLFEKVRGFLQTKPPAYFQELFSCFICLSFWIGIGLYLGRIFLPTIFYHFVMIMGFHGIIRYTNAIYNRLVTYTVD